MALDPPDWDSSAAAATTEAMNEFDKTLKKGGHLPPLQSHRIHFIHAMQTGIRSAMTWMAKLQKAGVPLESADACPELPTGAGAYGQCFQCAAPFHDPSARFPWKIAGELRDLCCTCNDKMAANRKRKK